MLGNILRVATRQGPLTLWQVHYVKDKSTASHPGLVVGLVPVMTHDDVIPDTPLAGVGGKGLFVEEPEATLLENRIDVVIHSMKDMPVKSPRGLGLVTICKHEDPRGASVSNTYDSLDALPADSIVGTSGLRRQCQLAERRPDLIIRSLHSNIGTRLSKLDNDEYDVIILIITELKRLGLESRIRTALPPEVSLPAVERGAMGIECHLDDARIRELFTALNHHGTALCVTAERTMNIRLEGGCQVPIGSYAGPIDGETWSYALIDAPDSSQIVHGGHRGVLQDAEQMGILLAEELLNNGAHEALVEVYDRGAPT